MRPWSTAFLYGSMIAATVGGFFAVSFLGRELLAPEPVRAQGLGRVLPPSSADTLLHVLLAMAIIIAVARILGNVFRRLNQPPVIGEVVAGILLGPSLLGAIAPGLSGYLISPAVAPILGVIAQVGVILYMFIVGTELDTQQLRHRTHASVAISHASIISPFLLGSSLALFLYPDFATSDVPFSLFALFMGVSMSVTAFPVLARILTDRGIHKSRMGGIALACAAVDDVTAWCLLAFVVSVAQARPAGVLLTVALSAGFIALMILVIRPLIIRFVRYYEQGGMSGQSMTAVACMSLLLCALATESIGIHALFGAFLLGSLIPHDSKVALDLRGRLEDIVIVLFLPVFFAFTGTRTQIGLLTSVNEWILCGVIIVVASTGKFGGSAIAARLSGLNWRQSVSLGILMNTRGLMELIVLNVGLDLGVLSPKLFAMMILMAVVTTIATTPILELMNPKEIFNEQGDDEESSGPDHLNTTTIKY
ncbi:MAG: cation:proton antiporter [Syntrophales bacterium]|nr:cation:proton antiporter [Syntrophales bacterium]